MSRTYRKSEDWGFVVHGVYYTWDEWAKLPHAETLGWNTNCTRISNGRDRKPWNKPPAEFKRDRQRIRRAQIKHFMDTNQYDIIPDHPNDDQWNWT